MLPCQQRLMAHLQKFGMGNLRSHRLERWRNLLAWPAPRRKEIDHDQLLGSRHRKLLIEFSLHTHMDMLGTM